MYLCCKRTLEARIHIRVTNGSRTDRPQLSLVGKIRVGFIFSGILVRGLTMNVNFFPNNEKVLFKKERDACLEFLIREYTSFVGD